LGNDSGAYPGFYFPGFSQFFPDLTILKISSPLRNALDINMEISQIVYNINRIMINVKK